MRRAALLAFFISTSVVIPVEGTEPPAPVVLDVERFTDLSPAPTLAPVVYETVQSLGTSGLASWYADKLKPQGALYAAVPGFVWGDEPYPLKVCTVEACVTVTVGDSCACYVGTPDERVIDLSPAAFARLAPLSVGLIPVEVRE